MDFDYHVLVKSISMPMQCVAKMDNSHPDLALTLQDSFRYGSSAQTPNRTSQRLPLRISYYKFARSYPSQHCFLARNLPWTYHILESMEK